MANGYTCCIDFERLRESLETLTSIENCLRTVDLPGFFIEIETELNNVNFEHGNCVPYYKGEIDSALYEYDKVKRKLDNLINSVTKTISEFESKDQLSYKDLQDLSTQYGQRAKLQSNIGGEIKVCESSLAFENDMDSSIKAFMIRNKSTDYPQEYSSYQAWKATLEQKYSNSGLTSQDIDSQVEKEIATWQQQQTGLSITDVATSQVAEEQSNINTLTKIYKDNYKLSHESAKSLATMQDRYDAIKNSADSSIEQIKQARTELDKVKEELGIRFRKANTTNLLNDMNQVTPNNQPVTTIPAPEVPQEVVQPNEINTVPIGLGIAATGIAGSIGAVVASEIKDRKNENLESYYESPKEQIEEKYEPSIDPYPVPKIEEVAPYHASRDKESLSKFYGTDDDIFKGND